MGLRGHSYCSSSYRYQPCALFARELVADGTPPPYPHIDARPPLKQIEIIRYMAYEFLTRFLRDSPSRSSFLLGPLHFASLLVLPLELVFVRAGCIMRHEHLDGFSQTQKEADA